MGRQKVEEPKIQKYITRSEVLEKLRLDSTTYHNKLHILGIEPLKITVNGRKKTVITEEDFNRMKCITDPATILRNVYKYEEDSIYK